MIQSIDAMEANGLRDYSVYGFWSYFVFLEGFTRQNWQIIASTCDINLGQSFMAFSLFMRASLIPLGVYQQIVALKMKILYEQDKEFGDKIRDAMSQRKHEEGKLHQQAHKRFRVENGIYSKL